MRPLIVASSILAFGVSIGFAQPRIVGIETFHHGAVASENFQDIYSAADGDYVACGESGQSWWVVRTNAQLRTEWSESYIGGTAFSIVEADNGDFVMGGASNGFAAMRISSEGESVWSRRYSEGGCLALIELKEGDFILVGYTGRMQALAIRIRSDGEVVWQNTYRMWPECQDCYFACLRETDEGVIVTGPARAPDRMKLAWVTKLSSDGGVLWMDSVRADTGVYCFPTSIVSSPNGGFLIGGRATQGVNGYYPLLIKITERGRREWIRLLEVDQGYSGYGYTLNRLRGGGYAFAGTLLQGGNPVRGFVHRLNENGESIWNTLLDFDQDERFQNNDNGLFGIVAGEQNEILAAGTVHQRDDDHGQDGVIVKIEPEFDGPMIIYHFPEDTNVTVLVGDSIRFLVRAINQQHQDMGYAWFYEDSLYAHDTTNTVLFDSLNQVVISGRVTLANSTAIVNWHVTPVDLFIARHTPDPLSLFLRRGTSQTFSLDTVRAVEGDPLRYQWTLNNLDNFEREDAGTESRATVEFLRSGNYQMGGLAYRGESSDNVIWTIAVRSAILDFWPRELRLSVPPDSSGEFGVIPFNPESDSLSYRWEVDGDSVGSDSTVTLSFAWNGQAGRSTYAVNAIVMDGAEGDTVRWEVTVQDPNATPPTPPSIEGSENPTTFGILSVSPNPFNSMTTIRYSTSGDAYPTRLTVHDLTGREVVRLVDERAQQSPPSRGGPYAIRLDGKELPAGVYLVRLETKQGVKCQKFVLVR